MRDISNFKIYVEEKLHITAIKYIVNPGLQKLVIQVHLSKEEESKTMFSFTRHISLKVTEIGMDCNTQL